jgi:hypothetical protein
MPTDPPKSRKRRSDIEPLQAAESPNSNAPDRAIDPVYAAAVQAVNRALAAERIPPADLNDIVVLEVRPLGSRSPPDAIACSTGNTFSTESARRSGPSRMPRHPL